MIEAERDTLPKDASGILLEKKHLLDDFNNIKPFELIHFEKKKVEFDMIFRWI